ncbi:hypothetical protein BJ322DRAFT_1022173 [Thelephora terrestris]|uniref:Serine-threonine/tyrosine-protein kinase catalytic domain-containing protein n=1 Tax=Thelephora terrestris TaxID=56493 RepID=A0A9P6HD46_9AGAM|nr:hypothetical protein BJ322DRAFT_1022173 [Thelephora terrestris]
MAKDFQQPWKNVTSANDEASAVRVLAEILTEKEGRAFVSRLERKDGEFCIEILDRNLLCRLRLFFTLRRLAGTHGRLPDSMMIVEKIKVEDEILPSGGGSGHMGHTVVVRILRTAATEDLRNIRKHFCREAILRNSLSHPHVLKLMGVYGDMERGQFITVTEWMVHGNVMDFIAKNYDLVLPGRLWF